VRAAAGRAGCADPACRLPGLPGPVRSCGEGLDFHQATRRPRGAVKFYGSGLDRNCLIPEGPSARRRSGR